MHTVGPVPALPVSVLALLCACAATPPTAVRWVLCQGFTTEWPVSKDSRWPHEDFIEQGGLRVGQVVHMPVRQKNQVRADF